MHLDPECGAVLPGQYQQFRAPRECLLHIDPGLPFFDLYRFVCVLKERGDRDSRAGLIIDPPQLADMGENRGTIAGVKLPQFDENDASGLEARRM